MTMPHMNDVYAVTKTSKFVNVDNGMSGFAANSRDICRCCPSCDVAKYCRCRCTRMYSQISILQKIIDPMTRHAMTFQLRHPSMPAQLKASCTRTPPIIKRAAPIQSTARSLSNTLFVGVSAWLLQPDLRICFSVGLCILPRRSRNTRSIEMTPAGMLCG